MNCWKIQQYTPAAARTPAAVWKSTWKIVFDTVYQHYCLVASIGKKRVSKTDIATGQVVEEMHLVAELEQRTYIEQQLAALGL